MTRSSNTGERSPRCARSPSIPTRSPNPGRAICPKGQATRTIRPTMCCSCRNRPLTLVVIGGRRRRVEARYRVGRWTRTTRRDRRLLVCRRSVRRSTSSSSPSGRWRRRRPSTATTHRSYGSRLARSPSRASSGTNHRGAFGLHSCRDGLLWMTAARHAHRAGERRAWRPSSTQGHAGSSPGGTTTGDADREESRWRRTSRQPAARSDLPQGPAGPAASRPTRATRATEIRGVPHGPRRRGAGAGY